MRLDTRKTLTSPRPSPLPPRERRGSVVVSHMTNRWLISARGSWNFKGANRGCSLSPRERVRVRANRPSLEITSRRVGDRRYGQTKDTHEH
jgi:hypothetical protein